MINPFKSKKGLGRGLSSLIGDGGIKQTNDKISISSIIPNRNQPRKFFEKEALNELTESIKERGIIQPLIVRRSEDQDNKFELIAGERRWQAAQSAGLHEVPVVVIEADNLKSLELAIIENVQRKDLNPIEEAESYKNLIDNFKCLLGVYLHLKIDFIKRNPKSGAINSFTSSNATTNDHTDFCCFGQI